jgi:uncharacterized protein
MNRTMDIDVDSGTSRRDVAREDFQQLAPRALWGMRVSALLGIVLPSAPPAAVVLAAWDSAGLGPGAKLAIFVGLMLLNAALAWRYASARYARTSYALDEAGLRIRRGVFWRTETLVPRSRVQHTDINRGPLDRHFGLATLKVYTAGTRLSSVSLDGLTESRAVELRDILVQAVDDVV